MKHSISLKLALAFTLVAVLTAVVLTLVFASSYSNRFQQFVFDQQFYAKLSEVESFYAKNQSWDGVESLLVGPASQENCVEARGGYGEGPGHGGGFRQTAQAAQNDGDCQSFRVGSHQYALADADGLVLVGIGNLYPEGSQLTQDKLNEGVPILDQNRQVGTLLGHRRNVVYTQAEQHFLERTNTGLIWALIITMVLAALIGFLLSRGLTRPVIELTAAAQNLAAGDLNQTVDVRSADELGELSQAFNRMSKKIEHSDRLRRQMTADIAHDLRTPLTVIGGYIESMRDGDLEATPERMDLIYSEITRLNRLVGDLRLLSQSDAGVLPMNLETVDARELLDQTRRLFDLKAREREIDLLVEAEQGLPSLMADESRLMQVLENLVSNAMRHTPQGGTIRLKAKIGSVADSKARGVEFIVSDSGEGIPPESLPDVFERFHRVDKSRHANQSQSGLGLAIVKVIVQAHKGEVWVESAIGKGSEFHFVIPVA